MEKTLKKVKSLIKQKIKLSMLKNKCKRIIKNSN